MCPHLAISLKDIPMTGPYRGLTRRAWTCDECGMDFDPRPVRVSRRELRRFRKALAKETGE